MQTNLPFSTIPGFSRLFNAFIAGETAIMDRFPGNARLLPDDSRFDTVLNNFNQAQRESLKDAIAETMLGIGLTEPQSKSLHAITLPNTLAVVTGQQVGFLAGPIYCIVKAFSAIAAARKLSEHHPALSFMPLFWVEDNDHDNLEASQAALFDGQGILRRVSCQPSATKTDRTSVSERAFEPDIGAIIDSVAAVLQDSANKPQLTEKLKQIYIPGKSWSKVFVELISWLAGGSGLLFLSASIVRQRGMFKRMVAKELEKIGETNRIVDESNSGLAKNGFHIQARSFDVNLFCHQADLRLNIDHLPGKMDDNPFNMGDRGSEIGDRTPDPLIPFNMGEYKFKIGGSVLSAVELQKLAADSPELFSPKVLLRPVFQDSIVPTAAYIAGPSEIGYLAQTAGLYDYFNVSMPAVVPRHSATFIDQRTGRLLDQFGLEAVYFFRQRHEIEAAASEIFTDLVLEEEFLNAKASLSHVLSKLNPYLQKIDQSLLRSASATEHKINQELERLRIKSIGTIKKRSSETLSRFMRGYDWLFPGSTLQERIVSPIALINLTGLEQFKKILTELTTLKADSHYFFELF